MSRPIDVWRLLNASCRDISRLASESLDRDLGLWERFALRSHLLYCRSCRRYLKQLRFLRSAVRQLAARIETGRSPALPDEARERIKRLLEDPSAPS